MNNRLLKFYIKNNLITDYRINRIQYLSELDDNDLLELYNNEFIRLFQETFKNSIYYKNLYDNWGIQKNDIKTIDDIVKLPVINRSSLINNSDKIYIGNHYLKVKGLTSGTSGSPAMVYRTPSSINKEQAYIRYYRKSYGFQFNEKIISIRGMLGKGMPSFFDRYNNILYISGPNINEKNIDYYYELINKFNPVAIEAFPSYLYKLYLELNKKNLSLKVKNIFTSSEMLYSFQRDKIESYFDSKIHDWYGNVERSICLVQNNENKYFPLPLYSINEFKETGIITTSLINNSFPLIRYEVDDRITVKSNDFYKNLISPEITQIEGRAGDTLELMDGSVVGCIDHAFKGVDNLIMAQIYQSISDKSIEIKLVVNQAFNQLSEIKLKQNLIRMLGTETPTRLTICNESELILHKNKKFRLIIKND